MESITHKAKRLGEKFMNDTEAQMGGVGTLYAVFFAAIVILAIIIIFTFVPGIGMSVQQSTPAAPAYGQLGGEWNSSDAANPNQAALQASSGAAIWTSTSGMLKVAVIIGIVVIILGSLFAIFQARQSQQGGGGGPM
jgi:hypothetical protein